MHRLFWVSLAILNLGICAQGVELDPEVFPDRKDSLARFEANFPIKDPNDPAKTISVPIYDFFSQREKDTSLDACRQILQKKMADFRDATEKGDAARQEAIMSGTDSRNPFHIRAREESTPEGAILAGRADVAADVNASSGLADLMQACGPCVAMVRVEKKTIYESDGWCLRKDVSEEASRKHFAMSEKALQEWKTYTRKKEGTKLQGFNYILAFGSENEVTPQNPIRPGDLAVIVVRAIAPFAFGYYGKIFFESTKEQDALLAKEVDMFSLQFALPKDLKGEDIPGIYQSAKDAATGQTYKVTAIKDEVWGRWFVDSTGVFNYHTRASFPKIVMLVPGMEKMAHRVMMDAVWHMHEGVASRQEPK